MDTREVFVRVVEDGSFTAAAKRLGVSTSYVSRCVRTLERDLGVALLARSTRSVRPTEAGLRYHGRVAPLLQGLVEADLEVSALVVEPRGSLTVALPHAFGRRWVLPTLLRFQQKWPDVQVQTRFSDRLTDPLAVDLTLRGGTVEDSALVARRLVRVEDVLVASPELLEQRGAPSDPEDLDGWPAALYTGHRQPNRWTLTSGVRSHLLDVRGVFFSDSGEAVVEAGVAGLGLVLQPEFLVGPALTAGQLVRVLPSWRTRHVDLWALTPSRLMPATVRAFVDELTADLSARPWLTPPERA